MKYISPTSLTLYEKNPDDFYLRYLAKHRQPRDPQTRPMSVGSAFDARAKSYIVDKLYGGLEGFGFDELFEEQVEKHNRDWALEAGDHAFNCYKRSGALAMLLEELEQSIGEPKFEKTVQSELFFEDESCILMGKPDCYFINKDGKMVILDWKVNGYCSNYPPSPVPGYVRLRTDGKETKSHKLCHMSLVNGMFINTNPVFEAKKPDWARQTSIYAWLCGAEVGSDFISVIHQLVCKKTNTGVQIRVAEHLTNISIEFQRLTMLKAQYLWKIAHSDHIFRDMSKERSKEKCAMLDLMYDPEYNDDGCTLLDDLLR